MEVVILPPAKQELDQLPDAEQRALLTAVEKLALHGPRLPWPHPSAVRQTGGLRELRPRQGKSPVRALYRRVGETMVIAAIGPEAKRDERGFDAAVRRAAARLGAD